ncbi:hypothetical protein Bhyg_02491, partial [Pseudolycoriella hygida]
LQEVERLYGTFTLYELVETKKNGNSILNGGVSRCCIRVDTKIFDLLICKTFRLNITKKFIANCCYVLRFGESLNLIRTVDPSFAMIECNVFSVGRDAIGIMRSIEKEYKRLVLFKSKILQF